MPNLEVFIQSYFLYHPYQDRPCVSRIFHTNNNTEGKLKPTMSISS